MQVQQLTPNGIQRLFKGETAIVQIIKTSRSVIARSGQSIQVINATINDGFAYFQTVYMFPDNFYDLNVENNVLRLKLAEKAVRKYLKGNLEGPLLVDSSVFAIVSNKVNKVIGCPIKYEQWIKNGKKNPKGSRKIAQQNNNDDGSDTDDDLFQQAQKLKQKLKQKQKQPKIEHQVKIEQTREISKPKKQVQNRGQSNTSRNSNEKSNQNSTSITVNQKSKPVQPSKPITKTQKPQFQQNQRRNSIKPQVKHHDQNHQKIKDLFIGMQNFRIVARLLFVWPVKNITNKKGNQSQILNLQFGDDTGTIMCTVFGDNASKFSGLQVDRIFSITGANVSQAKFRKQNEMKLNFNDGTRVEEVKQSQCKIPQIDKFCLSLKQLQSLQKGQMATVMCMVKQIDKIGFVSKSGNNVVKKMLKLFDIDNQVQCDLAVFNEKAQIEYEPGMYALKGIQIDEFQGNKQFKSSLIFLPRRLKNHALNKKLAQLQQITFQNINGNSNSKNISNKQIITSFHQLNQKGQNLKEGPSLWSQVVCYLKAIRLGGNSKNVYLGCPLCKKKILDQGARRCQSCGKDIDRPIYRYILNVNLIDDHDNIWLNAYDQVGQALLTKPGENPFTADKFAEMSQQQLRQRVQQIRYRQLKAKIVSNKQKFNNDIRLKHKIVKLLPIDYNEQAKILLEKIRAVDTIDLRECD